MKLIRLKRILIILKKNWRKLGGIEEKMKKLLMKRNLGILKCLKTLKSSIGVVMIQ